MCVYSCCKYRNFKELKANHNKLKRLTQRLVVVVNIGISRN